MASSNKLSKDRNQKQVLELVTQPGNNICADCKARNPRWASHNLGIFICVHCASIHRKIGTHITKVKSLTMDEWTREQVENMEKLGNIKSNSIYNPNELKYPPPPNLEDSERDSEIEQYIRSKYQYKKFYDRSALVASKLGPSRSASSGIRSSTLPPSSPSPTALRNSSARPSTSSGTPVASSISQRSISSQVPGVSGASQSAPTPPARPATSHGQSTPSSAVKRGGVWDDLNALASGGQNSSLPLQYQAQPTFTPSAPQAPLLHGVASAPMAASGFQSPQLSINPFAPSMTGASVSSTNSLPGSFIAQSQFGQQLMAGGVASQPSPIMAQPTSAPFYQPQPQTLQLQAPAQQSFLSPSPSQPFMSAPVQQTHFLTPSPSQQLVSHSPQLQQTATGMMFSNQPAIQSQFGANGFLGMTTMQMQQQQLMLQQQQQQLQQQQHIQQNMFGAPQMQPQMIGGMNMYGGTPMYVQGGQQWGTF